MQWAVPRAEWYAFSLVNAFGSAAALIRNAFKIVSIPLLGSGLNLLGLTPITFGVGMWWGCCLRRPVYLWLPWRGSKVSFGIDSFCLAMTL